MSVVRADLASTGVTKPLDVEASARIGARLKTAVELDRLMPLVFEHVFV
jgi:hypothetical protein